MTQEIKALLEVVEQLREKDSNDSKLILELEMKLIKQERGNDSLVERIKEKDNIINDLKDIVILLKPKKQEKEQK